MRGTMASRPKHAEPRPLPRLYLMTPRVADAAPLREPLAQALVAGDVAAVLLRFAETDERTQTNAAKALVALTQGKDVALLLDGKPELAARAGCDGAHLTGLEAFNDALDTLKPERIAGAGGLVTRHDAMTAAEAGADYVMFGEPDEHGEHLDFATVEERIGWWAELFEAPCVAYAGALSEIAPLVKAGADFIALGDWVWSDPDKIASTVADAAQRLRLPEPTT